MREHSKAHCPRCNGQRSCFVHATVPQMWDEFIGGEHVSWKQDHYLMQCQGCELVFYQQNTQNSEDYEVYPDHNGQERRHFNIEIVTFPKPDTKEGRPDWAWDLHKADHQLAAIMAEMYFAYESEMYILASVGLRTAFDRAVELLGIDPGNTLVAKLKKLHTDGFIGVTEEQTLAVVVDAGSAAAHRGWAPG